ncbi:MAG: hypothetical protein C0506_10605 [Anaerolinea sp.]|nr:hypothetical protein [Anaerolinea sp.]
MVSVRHAATFASSLLIALWAVTGGTHLALADGIGVYPTNVRFDDTLRGGEYFSTIGILNNLEGARTFRFEADGEIASWMSFVAADDRSKPVNEVEALKGADGQVLLRLQVPQTVSNGEYAGSVRAIVALDDASKRNGSSSGVNVAAVIEVRVRVGGTQRIEGALMDVFTNDIELGYPLRVRTVVANKGNVRVIPDVQVRVISGSTTVATIASVDTPIPPNEDRTIETQWDSNTAAPGNYIAKVSVSLPDKLLGERSLTFKILERGALSRQGLFERLELVNDPIPGSVAKIMATFRNTGQVESTAVFSGELYRDGILVKPVTSLQKLVRRDEVQKLEALIEVPVKGNYTIRGKVNFEGKETDEKELSFRVGAEQTGSTLGVTTLAGAGGAGAILLAAAVAAFVYRRRRGPQPAGA